MTAAKDLLEGKRILLVDDEPDVLASLADLLPMCETVKASNFKAAKAYLENEYFDLTVLDIMGVEGYQLLEIANQKRVSARKTLSNRSRKVPPPICPKKKWSTSPLF
jgi:DNA-binding response OmpR family regulator